MTWHLYAWECDECGMYDALFRCGVLLEFEMRAMKSDVRQPELYLVSWAQKMNTKKKIFRKFPLILLLSLCALCLGCANNMLISIENDCKLFCNAFVCECMCGSYETNRASVSLDLFMGKLFLFHICFNG